MKITLCGSMQHMASMLTLQKKLETMGFVAIAPDA